jgi:hypothetical protein
MSDVLVIRTAEAEDINAIGYLAYQIWPSAYKDILNFEQLHYMLQYFYSPESLREQMLKKHHVFLIAETEEEERSALHLFKNPTRRFQIAQALCIAWLAKHECGQKSPGVRIRRMRIGRRRKTSTQRQPE